MPSPVTSIRNLGPASAKSYAKAGLTSADEIRALGPDAAYERVLRAGSAPHFIAYCALVMGLQGRPWTDPDASEKAALRARFDALKARVATDDTAERERLLDALGVRPARP